MLFNSLPFIFLFFPFVLGISMRLRGQALLRWIVLSSFFFYAFAGHAWFLIPMLITTVLDFVIAPHIAANAGVRKKGFLMVSICGNLGLLFYFKYSGLLLRTVGLPIFDVILPAGISFYTFQTLSYVLDVYRGDAEPETNFWRFAGFVSFFPHLVAGPLTRHDQLIPGLARIAEEGIKPRWKEGVFLFCMGLSKKILVADRVAKYIDPMIDGMNHPKMAGAWLALLGYALQIYFDFSGYSDMAIGLARLFGIELPQNFDSPYQATSPSDFWRRWHITLSRWLRDYLYIPLGGNRCGEVRRNFNLMATMVLGGLWHGANWTFAAWGCYHGLLLVVHHRTQTVWDRQAKNIQRAVTFLAVTLGWVFFRSPTFPGALDWFRGLAGFYGAGIYGVPKPLPALVAAGLGLAWFFPNASSYKGFGELSPRRQVALAIATSGAVLLINYSSRFLYFQF